MDTSDLNIVFLSLSLPPPHSSPEDHFKQSNKFSFIANDKK